MRVRPALRARRRVELADTQRLKLIRWTHEEVLRLKASDVLAGKAATVKLQ